jgi:hypothetical protein
MFTANLKHGDTQIELIKLDITKFIYSTDTNSHRFAQMFMARKTILTQTFVEKCLSFKIITEILRNSEKNYLKAKPGYAVLFQTQAILEYNF